MYTKRRRVTHSCLECVLRYNEPRGKKKKNMEEKGGRQENGLILSLLPLCIHLYANTRNIITACHARLVKVSLTGEILNKTSADFIYERLCSAGFFIINVLNKLILEKELKYNKKCDKIIVSNKIVRQS